MATSRFPSDCVCDPCDAPGPILPLHGFERDDFEMVETGPAMSRLRTQIQRIGPHFRVVVVSGEPGTGKGLAARALHRLSPAANGRFIVCRARECSTKDVDLMVKTALGGTLFLEGISEMPMQTQSHLLRVLRRQDG